MRQAMSLVTLAAPFGGVRGRLTAAFQQDRTGVGGLPVAYKNQVE